jgi:hypothetical protein
MKTWADEEVSLLELLYPYRRAKDIVQFFNGKSLSAITHKVSRLKVSKNLKSLFEIRSKAQSGANSGNFKNYRRTTPKGYIMLYKPNHPNASKHGLVMEHRFVMSNHLGRALNDEERVHHVNENKKDNRIENLQIMGHGEHSAYHNLRRGLN